MIENNSNIQVLKAVAANSMIQSYCNRGSQLENKFVPEEKRQAIASLVKPEEFTNPEFLAFIGQTSHDINPKRVDALS